MSQSYVERYEVSLFRRYCASRRAVAAIVAAACALASTGPAAAGPPIVIEIHVGERPDDADRFVAPVLEHLAARGYRVGVEGVGLPYEQIVSRPAIAEAAEAKKFAALVEQGEAEFFAPKLESAILVFGSADAIYQKSPGALLDKESRDRRKRVLVLSAMAHDKLSKQTAAQAGGHARDAEALMGELVRSYPDTPIPEFGPEPEKMRRKAETAAKSQSPGTLRVQVDGDAMVFIDEAFAGRRQVEERRPPGEYRVLVMPPDSAGRLYRVKVESDKATEIHAIASFVAALHTSPVWVGGMFATEAIRAKDEPAFVRQVGSDLDAHETVVLRFARVNNRLALIGVVYDRDGQLDREASMMLEPKEPSVEKLQMFAEYLGRERETWVDDDEEEDDDEGGATPRDLRWVRYPIFGAGIAAIIAGIALVATDGSCVGPTYIDRVCPKVWKTATGGYVALGAGTALVGTALWMHFTGRKEEPPAAVSVERTGGMFFVQGRF